MATGNICIFGSSSNNIDRKYIDAACETGALLAENGLGMVFGGGAVGLMGAAAEGCRLLATSEEVSGAGDEGCEQAIRRRLGAIPSQELFHVHEGECSYQIGLEGSEATERVQVTIENKLRPLPILDMGATLLGLTDSEGCLTCKVQVSLPTQDEWVAQGSLGLNPSGWANAREGTS